MIQYCKPHLILKYILKAHSIADLIITPARVYGTHEASHVCQVQDRTFILVQRCNDWLRGVILPAEVDILGSKAAEVSMLVLSRRASIYRSAREDLSIPKSSYFDTAITRIPTIALPSTELAVPLRMHSNILGL